jgi:outer membrane lipoprotein-sorting protein
MKTDKILRGLMAIFLLLLCKIGAAQDLKNALLDMQKQYEGMSGLHIKMDVEVYENKVAKTPYFEMDVDIKKQGENYLYKYGSNDMLLNQKYLIMVDHQTKEIILNDRDRTSEEALKKNFQFNLDSIMIFYKDIQYVGKQNAIQHYKLVQKKGMVRNIDMYINENTKLLSKMEYEYTNKQFVSITFKAFEKDPSFDEGLFSEKEYLLGSRNTFLPSQKYKGYEILK